MDLPSWLLTRPIAHRGLFDAEHPENSMAAFRNAVSRGIPFEMDVQLAEDGLLVVVHDRDLRRLTGSQIATSQVDRSKLRYLRIGASDEPIPLLRDVLDEVNDRVPILVDVRRWTVGVSSQLEREVVAAIRGYTGPLAVQSFDPLTVLRFRRLIRTHPVGQVSGRLESAGRITRFFGRAMAANLLSRPDFVNIELKALPSRYVDFWRDQLDIPVIAWTVESAEDEDRARRLASNFLFDSYLPAAYRQAADETGR